ncbi:hypothetical protein PCANC_15961 [Puccinia coronata f. sp. avenae]|uniref:Uncharacterized protein n=1 Tax=Puccinia coronata f. sp. avenae TaxID=200324 RepID=A0A2N5SMH2_9BASI|nr:hypothetical protein PCANC_15961 [Puccinia coronata f. sp. avenae]PLW44057.1 hypothetical protein PCASD_04869 [Puccinia coronata f. sp. avenae]
MHSHTVTIRARRFIGATLAAALILTASANHIHLDTQAVELIVAPGGSLEGGPTRRCTTCGKVSCRKV